MRVGGGGSQPFGNGESENQQTINFIVNSGSAGRSKPGKNKMLINSVNCKGRTFFSRNKNMVSKGADTPLNTVKRMGRTSFRLSKKF